MVAAIRSDDLRSQNRARVVGAVRREGVASRTEIAASTGLSPATISAITSDFIEEGILMPAGGDGTSSAGRGRPKVTLSLDPAASLVCAVYFHMNRISATIGDYQGTTISKHSIQVPTLNASVKKIRLALITCIDKALSDIPKAIPAGPHDLSRIAIGIQGVVDAEGRTVLWSPICQQRNIPVSQWLEARFDVPTRVSNDCDLIAQAIRWREPKKYGVNFSAVLLDHGVGMGLYLHQDIVNGTYSSGVEFGHMCYIPNGALCRCGNRGCIEAYAGDYAISRRANGYPEDTLPTDLIESSDLQHILEAAASGNADALAAIEAAGAAIGTGLSNLYALLDRFPVVLVGRGTIFFDTMEAALRSGMSTAPGYDDQEPIDIVCYREVTQLVTEGGAVSALQLLDLDIAANRVHLELSP